MLNYTNSHYYSENKLFVRDRINSLLPKRINRLISLPFRLEWELSIIKKYDCTADCFERDVNNYNILKQTVHSKVNLHNKDILSYKTDNQYDVVWLDLCSLYTKSNFDKVNTFINNIQLSNNWLFGLTLVRGRVTPHIPYDDVLATFRAKFIQKTNNQVFGEHINYGLVDTFLLYNK